MGEVGQVDGHFVELRSRIRKKIRETCGEKALAEYPDWLYGALGDPGADVMFVCENPSRAGIEWADECFGDLGIEAQWCAPPADRFRRVLCRTGLKCGRPYDCGGWRCYITNVIKEVWAVEDFNALSAGEKTEIAHKWAEVLRWEVARVEPKIVFCVGGRVRSVMGKLASDQWGGLAGAHFHKIWHYAARRGDARVFSEMQTGIVEVWKPDH